MTQPTYQNSKNNAEKNFEKKTRNERCDFDFQRFPDEHSFFCILFLYFIFAIYLKYEYEKGIKSTPRKFINAPFRTESAAAGAAF